MRYKEQDIAEELFRALKEYPALSSQDIAVSIEGKGVHWQCAVQKNARRCTIHCFGNSQYFIEFEELAAAEAYGRSFDRVDVIWSASHWLEGQSIEDLYKQFDFVDKSKRSLETTEKEVVNTCPELSLCAPNLRYPDSEFCELWFENLGRKCSIFPPDKNGLSLVLFYWDDCMLFQIQADNFKQLALILKRWLYDNVMPSALEAEFSWIDIGPIAPYYEAGRGIEGEFIVSWVKIEEFYKDFNLSSHPEIFTFISQIRQLGYDKEFRAGQSTSTLILSRSRRHGLRDEQSCIYFIFDYDGRVRVRTDIDGETKEQTFSKIELTPEVDSLLRQLMMKAID
jgi:hypothetical protein